MKKIALIKNNFRASGGLEKVTHRILNALLEKNAQVSLFTTSPADIACPIYSHAPKGLFKFQQLLNFDRWALHQSKEETFDVTFSMDRCSFQTHHRAGNGVHAAYLDLRSKTEGALKAFSFSLNPLHQLHLKLEKATFEGSQTQTIIVNSALVRQQILHYYNTPASKIHVIHNGVEWKEMEKDFNDSVIHRKEYALKLGLNPSVFQFLFIGHNFERKGLRVALQALALLKKKDFHLSVVGSDKNISSYRLLVSRLGLDHHVTFFGPQLNSQPFYLASDALLIPSLYDPFANVTIEALALGLFVISSKMNGGHEILISQSGVIVENPENVEEFTTALEIALEHPKEISQSTAIRSSVAHLDYSYQLEKICRLCLN